MDCTFHIIAITYREREKYEEKKNISTRSNKKRELFKFIHRTKYDKLQDKMHIFWFDFFFSIVPNPNEFTCALYISNLKSVDISNVCNATVFISAYIIQSSQNQMKHQTKQHLCNRKKSSRKKKWNEKQTSRHTVNSDNLMKLHQVDWLNEIEFQIIMVLLTNQSGVIWKTFH